MIKPEQLKKLAECMGKQNVSIVSDSSGTFVFYMVDSSPVNFEYYPLENAEQAGELLSWFIKNSASVDFVNNGNEITISVDIRPLFYVRSKGKDWKEAVTLAAINYMESENGL